MTQKPQFINNINQISYRYQYFIFDIWGVIHDGESAYDGVLEVIKYLRSKNKKICFVSNAPRRKFVVAKLLEKFGIGEDLYDFVITSGEVTFLKLQENQENGFKKLGSNYLYIGPKKDEDLLHGLNYNIVQNASHADFVINTGFDNDNSSEDEKLSQIKECAKHNLMMICVNPDLKVVKKDGRSMNCAGLIAKQYQELGGKVEYYGKPYPAIYEIACNLFNTSQKSSLIAIGDGLETDILGALNNKIDSLLITGGLLSNFFKIKYWQDCDPKKLDNLCKEQNIFPNYIISNLKL